MEWPRVSLKEEPREEQWESLLAAMRVQRSVSEMETLKEPRTGLQKEKRTAESRERKRVGQ